MCKSEIKGPIIFLDFLVLEKRKNLEEPISVLFFVKSTGCIWNTPYPKAPKQVTSGTSYEYFVVNMDSPFKC